MASSREIYRQWKRELKEDVKEFGQWRLDEINTFADLRYHYNQFLVELGMALDEAENRNPLPYVAKGEKDIDKAIESIVKRFGIDFEENIDEELELNKEPIFGIEINSITNTAALKKRKRLFPDLASLIDYMQDVPYPAGIETVRDARGRIVGYYLWVEK